MGFGVRRRLEAAAEARPLLRRVLTQVHLAREMYGSARAAHPFDRRYGVRTQSRLPLHLNRTGSDHDAHLIPYGGCVPSVVERALAMLTDDEVRAASFLDLGCGKGRALIVASERPFRRVIGVEINPDLVQAARRNAAHVARRHRGRPPFEVREGDASRPDWPEGEVVVFMYHPFGEELVLRLRDHVASRPTGGTVVIYENPVHGGVFDADPRFVRRFAGMLDYRPDEIGFGFDRSESLVVWRCGAAADTPAHPDADLPIRVTKAGYRAVVGDGDGPATG